MFKKKTLNIANLMTRNKDVEILTEALNKTINSMNLLYSSHLKDLITFDVDPILDVPNRLLHQSKLALSNQLSSEIEWTLYLTSFFRQDENSYYSVPLVAKFSKMDQVFLGTILNDTLKHLLDITLEYEEDNKENMFFYTFLLLPRNVDDKFADDILINLEESMATTIDPFKEEVFNCNISMLEFNYKSIPESIGIRLRMLEVESGKF